MDATIENGGLDGLSAIGNALGNGKESKDLLDHLLNDTNTDDLPPSVASVVDYARGNAVRLRIGYRRIRRRLERQRSLERNQDNAQERAEGGHGRSRQGPVA